MPSPSWRRNALPTSGVVVLLVDSHDDSRNMYAEYLRACWFTVRAADTSDQGLLYAGDADVIVTEIRVRGSFDGVELVRRVKNSEATRETPVLVLTGSVLESERERALTAGCDRFLSRPCPPAQLVSEIRAALVHRIVPKQKSARWRPTETERKRDVS
jgi:CheY-like chemotaxis protein